MGTGKVWGDQQCPHSTQAVGRQQRPPSTVQVPCLLLSTSPVAPSKRYADCQGTNATPLPFFKRLNIKRPKCSSYFNVNVAAKYYHFDVACKTKAIDNVISARELLCHSISFTCTETCYLCLPAQHRSSAPWHQGLSGLCFPLFWAFNLAEGEHALLLLSNGSFTQCGCSPESPWVKMINDGESTGCSGVNVCFSGQEEGISPGREEETSFGWSSPQEPCKPLLHPPAALSKCSHKNPTVCPLHAKP